RAGGRTTLPLAVKLTNDILCDTGPRAGVFAIDQTILKSSGSGKLSYRRKLNTVRTILRLLAAAVLSAMQRSVLPSVLQTHRQESSNRSSSESYSSSSFPLNNPAWSISSWQQQSAT